MLLLDLPNELLCQICESLQTVRDVASFNKVNRQTNQLARAYLYQLDAREADSSALLWAAGRGRLEIAQKALEALEPLEKNEQLEEEQEEAEVESNPILNAALVLAAEHGHDTLVRLFVDGGADMGWRHPDQNHDAMEVACKKGHIHIVKLLIELGDSPCGGNIFRPHPIQCAAMMGHTEIVGLLIDEGESPDKCTGRPEGGSFTPLQHAVKEDREDTAKLLIAKGAKINLRIGRGRTALEHAVITNCLWAVRLLIDAGAMVFAAQRELVRSPALEMAKRPGREEIYELLKNESVHVWPRTHTEEGQIAIQAMR